MYCRNSIKKRLEIGMRAKFIIIIFLLTIIIVSASVETLSVHQVVLGSTLEVEPNIEVITAKHDLYLKTMEQTQQQSDSNPGLPLDGEKSGEDINTHIAETTPADSYSTTSDESVTDAQEENTGIAKDMTDTSTEESGTSSEEDKFGTIESDTSNGE